MRRCCVFFHAHPDDEALLTAGTMAGLAASGHRVVLVVATAGEHGLAAGHVERLAAGHVERLAAGHVERLAAGHVERLAAGHVERLAAGHVERLAAVRMAEAHASAELLGCARVAWLGYADSGLGGDAPVRPGGGEPFATADVTVAAARLAEILEEEQADLLTSYDPVGGYGHPDHVQVNRVGALAAELAGTPVVLEATVDRELLLRALRLVSVVYPLPAEFDRGAFRRAYSPRAEITHRVNVRRFADAKRASMAAHVSQATGGDSARTLAALLRLPGPVFRRALGTEFFVRRDLAPGVMLRHPLQSWPVTA